MSLPKERAKKTEREVVGDVQPIAASAVVQYSEVVWLQFLPSDCVNYILYTITFKLH